MKVAQSVACEQHRLNPASASASFLLPQVQDTVLQLDASALGGEGGNQQQQQQQQQDEAAAQQLVPMVWELNKLRSMLAAVVLQWATCLQEGAAGSHAAPPSGGGLLSSILATRRQAGGRHSRRGSMAEEGEGPEAAVGELPLSPTSQAAEQQLESGPSLEQRQQARQPAQQQQAQPAGHALQRSVSGASLGQQFLEAGLSQDLGRRAASELDFGAPSLVGGEEGMSGASLATSPLGGGAVLPAPASIPTGLVARYVAMFDQRGPEAGGGSPGTSPTSQRRRSQRTLNWVQASSPAASEGGAAEAEAATSPAERGAGPAAGGEAAAQQQQGAAQHVSPPQPPLTRQRSSLFRLDLTSPDPDLARALTPSRRRTSGVWVPFVCLVLVDWLGTRCGLLVHLWRLYAQAAPGTVTHHQLACCSPLLLPQRRARQPLGPWPAGWSRFRRGWAACPCHRASLSGGAAACCTPPLLTRPPCSRRPQGRSQLCCSQSPSS